MPSTNQSSSDKEFASKQQRFIASSMDILPLLRGIMSREQARQWLAAMNKSDREFPDGYYEIVEGKLRELGELEDGT